MKKMKLTEVAKAVNGQIIHGNSSLYISSVSTNSKDQGQATLFVPIIGEKHDAHNFIEDAYNHGGVACFTSRDDIYHEGIACIKVEDTLVALQDLATYYRSKLSIPIIGITGSVGKTSTKEIVSSGLSTGYNVLKTAGNLNSQIGLPLMILRIEEEHEIAVIEMGISEEGEMDKLVAIAKPDIAVVTNIGISHIGQLKTKENIRKEKLNIINKFNAGSKLFINGNDSLLFELTRFTVKAKNKEYSQNYSKIDLSKSTYDNLISSEIISFGTKEENDYSAKDIKVIDEKTYFTLINNRKNIEEDITLNVLGEHNINNALCALAIADYFDLSISEAKKGLEEYKPITMRGEIKKIGDLTIVDDTYNASPDSMKSAIEVLLSITGIERRIAVLADVLELGSISHMAHFDLGEFISKKNIDVLVTIGREAEFIAQGLKSNNKEIITKSFMNNNEAIKYLEEIIRPGDGLLVKGSRGMRTEEIVNYFLNN